MGAIFFFKREILRYLSSDEACVLEKEPLVKLARDRELGMWKHRGFWYAMDTQRDREHLNKLWDSGNAPWSVIMIPFRMQSYGKAARSLMKVFVTGHKGYIGAHLVELLKQAGHTVTGCDLGLFDGCAWEKHRSRRPRYPKRCPACHARGSRRVMIASCIWRRFRMTQWERSNAAATYAINRDASIRIAQLAKKAGVPRYLFAASCSVYGAGRKARSRRE